MDDVEHVMSDTTPEAEELHEMKVDCWCGPVIDGRTVFHGDLGPPT